MMIGPLPLRVQSSATCGRAAHREHVHAVDLKARDPVRLPAPEQLGLGGRPRDAGAHRILVVLDRVDDRQVPQLGHVEGLVDLALVDRAVAHVGEADAAIVAILVPEGESRPQRHLRADDAVAAVEAMVDAEHVHRPALALGNAGRAPGQLGHDDLRVDAVGEHVAMVAVAGDDAVLADRQRRLEPDRDRFLPDIEVAEPADQPEPVELPRPLLEAANEKHFAVELEKLVLARLVALGLRRARAVGGCGLSRWR